MSKRAPQLAHITGQGTLLGTDGKALGKGVWEDCVYLGSDNFVYHLIAETAGGDVKVTIAGKRSIGEYLRWVDGLFKPGELPGEANAIHYRAARKLRELL